jgi:hypothetical protein
LYLSRLAVTSLLFLQVNVARMTLKMRRAEIEERMDSGMSYEAAGMSVLDSRRTMLFFTSILFFFEQ